MAPCCVFVCFHFATIYAVMADNFQAVWHQKSDMFRTQSSQCTHVCLDLSFCCDLVLTAPTFTYAVHLYLHFGKTLRLHLFRSILCFLCLIFKWHHPNILNLPFVCSDMSMITLCNNMMRSTICFSFVILQPQHQFVPNYAWDKPCLISSLQKKQHHFVFQHCCIFRGGSTYACDVCK